MKKFILECVIGTILICLIGWLLYNMPPAKGINKKIYAIDQKLEIVNLGTSHGNSFDYSNYRLHGARINRGSNTLYYDLQNYLFLKENDHLSENAIVIIPLSYFAFGLDENRTDRLPDDSFVNDFYHYLPKENIFSYSRQKHRNLILSRIQENAERLVPFSPQKKTKEPSFQDFALRRAKLHKNLRSYAPNGKSLNYLDTLIQEILKDKNLPVLVTTPYHHIYNDYFGAEWLNKSYFEVVKKYSSKYNITYLDYSRDERFSFQLEYFKNADHLNSKGRRVFSQAFFKDIDSCCVRNAKSHK